MTEQTLPIETFAPRTPLQEFWFYFKQNKGAVIDRKSTRLNSSH